MPLPRRTVIDIWTLTSIISSPGTEVNLTAAAAQPRHASGNMGFRISDAFLCTAGEVGAANGCCLGELLSVRLMFAHDL